MSRLTEPQLSPRRLLATLLCCPSCGGRLQTLMDGHDRIARDYGILACACSRYPVLAGIPIFKTGPAYATDQTAAALVSLIEKGQPDEALIRLLRPNEPCVPALAPAWLRRLPATRGIGRVQAMVHRRAVPGWRRRATAFLSGLGDGVTACDMLEFYFRFGMADSNAYDYFALRFGQPRHLVALSLASLLREPAGPVLELACGFGHVTRSLVRRAGGQPVIAMDRDFFPLYVAKNWIAPEAWYVCGEADTALPFPNGVFSTAFSVDGIHYFLDKTTSVRELRRVTQEDALIVLAVARNARVPYPYAGFPLTPEGYQALVADIPHRVLADSDILSRYFKGLGPALAEPASHERLSEAPLLSIVASNRPSVFQDEGPFQDWPHAEGRLSVNPLYVVDGSDQPGPVRLRRVFPSAWYEKDNAECKQYLPEEASVHSEVLLDVNRGRRTPAIEKLIEQCVVLGLPERYM